MTPASANRNGREGICSFRCGPISWMRSGLWIRDGLMSTKSSRMNGWAAWSKRSGHCHYMHSENHITTIIVTAKYQKEQPDKPQDCTASAQWTRSSFACILRMGQPSSHSIAAQCIQRWGKEYLSNGSEVDAYSRHWRRVSSRPLCTQRNATVQHSSASKIHKNSSLPITATRKHHRTLRGFASVGN